MSTIFFAALRLSLTILSLFPLSNANDLGFSIDLIHRDSPPSPFHNPLLTSFEHLSNSLKRSHNRANRFISLCERPKSVSSKIIPTDGGYLMKIALGTPRFKIFALADTGSDLTWTQCSPCTQCYKQKAPLFDTKKSSTYHEFSCESSTCRSLSNSHTSCGLNNTCEYTLTYGDRSHSRGTIASETLTLSTKEHRPDLPKRKKHRPVSFPNIIFGCGTQNAGTFGKDGSGIVGLGGGSESLISQLNSTIKGKFSYCLVPMFTKEKKSSQIHFGKNAVVSGLGVVSTPITMIQEEPFYRLTLEALSIGKDRINLVNSLSDNGNMIIDSGTTLTFLPSNAYTSFESLIKKAMGDKTVHDPLGILSLCYRVSDKPSFPNVTAHFTGADVELKPINTFVETSDDVTCLAFAQTGSFGINIWGNIAQINFKVGYDIVQKTVSFKPSICGSVDFSL